MNPASTPPEPGDGDAPTERRRPGRPRGGHAAIDREQLIAAATRAITAIGPSVTLDDIAQEANVSKPILYRTIGDKAELVAALSECLIDRIDTAVRAASSGHTDPRVQFEASVRGYLTAVEAERNLFLFVNSGVHDPTQTRRLIERSSEQLVDIFTTIRQHAGRDTAAARTWAYAIIGAFQSVTTMWLGDEYCHLGAVAEDLTLLLWPGVAQAGAGA